MTALAEKLRSDGHSVTEDDQGSLTIESSGDETVAAVWTASHETGTVISSMIPAHNSMESIFLDAVGENQLADS